MHDTLGNNSGSSDLIILFLYHSKLDIIKVKPNRVKSQFTEKPWLRNLVYEREFINYVEAHVTCRDRAHCK